MQNQICKPQISSTFFAVSPRESRFCRTSWVKWIRRPFCMECVSPAKALAFNGRRPPERSLGFSRFVTSDRGQKRSDFFKKQVLSLDDFFGGWIEWEKPCLHSNWALQTKSNPFPPLGSAAWKLPFSGHSLIPFPGLSLQRERGRVQGSIAATLGSESIVLEDTLKDVWCSACFGPWWQWRCLQCT